MTFRNLFEYFVKFINQIWPSLEALLVGALLAGGLAVGDYLYGGNPFTVNTVWLVFGGAALNYATSRARHLYAKRLLTDGQLIAQVTNQVQTQTVTVTATNPAPIEAVPPPAAGSGKV